MKTILGAQRQTPLILFTSRSSMESHTFFHLLTFITTDVVYFRKWARPTQRTKTTRKLPVCEALNSQTKSFKRESFLYKFRVLLRVLSQFSLNSVRVLLGILSNKYTITTGLKLGLVKSKKDSTATNLPTSLSLNSLSNLKI